MSDEITKEKFELEYKKFKQLQNSLMLLQVCTSFCGLFFIHILASANQFGLFKKESKLSMWRTVEISALIICLFGLAIALTNIGYTNKKKAELEEKSNTLIIKLEGNSDENASNDLSEENQKVKSTLESIKNSLKKESELEIAARYCGITAAFIFVAMEIVAVTNLFKDFGLSTAHKKVGLPINIQGIVDSIGLAFVLSAALLTLLAKKEEKKQEKGGNEKDYKYLILPSIAVAGVAINLFGKVIQGMEAGGSLSFFKSENGSFPVGFSIRIVAGIIGIALLLNSIGKVMDKSADSEFQVEIATSNTPGINGGK